MPVITCSGHWQKLQNDFVGVRIRFNYTWTVQDRSPFPFEAGYIKCGQTIGIFPCTMGVGTSVYDNREGHTRSFGYNIF